MSSSAFRSKLLSTSPSLTRVSQRSQVLPALPKADLRFETISRFLPSGDHTGLMSAAFVSDTTRWPEPSAFIT